MSGPAHLRLTSSAPPLAIFHVMHPAYSVCAWRNLHNSLDAVGAWGVVPKHARLRVLWGRGGGPGGWRQAQVLLLPVDPLDERNIMLEVRAGPGGEEAALWAADLVRM